MIDELFADIMVICQQEEILNSGLTLIHLLFHVSVPKGKKDNRSQGTSSALLPGI